MNLEFQTFMKRMFTGVHEFFLRDLRKFELIGPKIRGGSRTTATSKEELFVIIINGWKPLTIITKSSTLDVAAVQDPENMHTNHFGGRERMLWEQMDEYKSGIVPVRAL